MFSSKDRFESIIYPTFLAFCAGSVVLPRETNAASATTCFSTCGVPKNIIFDLPSGDYGMVIVYYGDYILEFSTGNDKNSLEPFTKPPNCSLLFNEIEGRSLINKLNNDRPALVYAYLVICLPLLVESPIFSTSSDLTSKIALNLY